MHESFKTRVVEAGYPSSLYCFHSLRNGFICSTLIKCGAKEEKQKEALEKTTLIVGWTPFCFAQAGHIKNVVKLAMVASRLVSHEDEGENEPIIDETLLELETFQGI
ncbi:uncharacterized protein MONOS_17884 [Monocercomonoides exilis]|uniref:uncharacterized protein n=1 Tax=Monocercomonoides exilis TaxID=2049356 RepID=UPI003559FC1D|nr:hypothetical protein MONOS_17884 [Monocercomonoides exilis]